MNTSEISEQASPKAEPRRAQCSVAIVLIDGVQIALNSVNTMDEVNAEFDRAFNKAAETPDSKNLAGFLKLEDPTGRVLRVYAGQIKLISAGPLQDEEETARELRGTPKERRIVTPRIHQ